MSQETFYKASDKEKGTFKHHGTALMKWGDRNYQNADGTWTEEGKARRRAQYAYEKGGSKYTVYGDGGATIFSKKKSYTPPKSDVFTNIKGDKSSDDKGDSKKKDSSGGAKNNSVNAVDMLRTADQIGKEAGNIAKNTAEIIDVIATVNGKKQAVQLDLSSISNEEMQKVITRATLEKRYREIMTPPKPDNSQKVKDFITVVGGITGIGLSVATIIGKIHEMKGK